MKNKTLLVAGLALGCLFAQAGTYTWTGAQDAFWTNAANWTVSGAVATVPPGSIETGDTENPTSGDATDAAVFGACTGATRIDLSGLHAIASVTVSGATAPQYTFGAAASQVLHMAMGGTLTVASDVTQPPTIAALGLGTDIVTSGSLALTVRNDSAAELTLEKYGYITRGTGAPGWGEAQLKFLGTGPVRFTQQSTSLSGWQIRYSFYGTNRILVDATLNGTHGVDFVNSSTTPLEVVLANNAQIVFNDIYCTCYCNANVSISGAGKLLFKGGNTSALRDPAMQIATGKTLTVGSDVTVENTTVDSRIASVWTPGIWRTDAGTLVMEGTLNAAGGFRLRGGTTQVSRADQIATGDRVEISSGATLAYAGAGETFTKTLVVTNGAATVLQKGTGAFVVSGALETGSKTGTLTLDNASTAGASWATASAAAISATMKGAWTLAAALPNATLTLASGATLALDTTETAFVGTLALNGQALDLSSQVRQFGLSCVSGKSSLTLASGTTLTSLACTSGTLDVRAAEEVVTVSGQGAGAAPGWLSLNGNSAGFDAQGRLVYLTYPETTAIAAHGGVVPNEATAVVGITTPGTSGTVTLVADQTAVATLVQKTTEPATVTIGADQTLTVGTLARTKDAAALTVGATKGVGTLAAAAEGLTIDNASTTGELTVQAALSGTASQTLTKNGTGAVTFDNAFAWPGTIAVNQGEFRVVDPAARQTATLTGSGAYVIEGSGTQTLATAASGFTGSLVLRGGVTRFTQPSALGANGATIAISNNAALDISGGLEGQTFSQMSIQNRTIYLEGAGPDGLGAIRPEAFNAVAGNETGVTNQGWSALSGDRVVLTGDATIGSPNPTRWYFSNSAIDQQNHTLTFNNAGRLSLNGTTVTNAGPVVVRPQHAYGGGLLFESKKPFGEADAPAVTAYTNAMFTWAGVNAGAQTRPLVVHGPITFYNFHNYNNKVLDSGYNGWLGPVSLADDNSILTLQSYNCSDRALRLEGPISGPGGIKATGNGLFYIVNPTNSFTGKLDCQETNWGRWEFGYGGSIPVYSNAWFGLGNLALVADDTNRWTMAQFVAFMNEGHFSKDKTNIGFDTTYGDQRLVLDNLEVTNTAYNSFCNYGPGKIIVEGPGVFPGAGLKLSVTGTVEITGHERVQLLTTGDQFTLRPITGGFNHLLEICDADWVEFPPEVSYYVGCWNTNYFSRMRIMNSRVVNPAYGPEAGAHGQMLVGASGSRGYVEIDGASSVVSNRIVLGQAGGCGALYMRNGEVADLGPMGWTYANIGDSGGCGYLEQTGGHLVLNRAHRIGFYRSGSLISTGVMSLLGGTAEAVQWEGQTSGSSLNIGVSGAKGHLYLNGGSLTTCGSTVSLGEHNQTHTNGFGVVTLEGNSALVQKGVFDMAHSVRFTAILNLNGGVLEAETIRKNAGITGYLDSDGYSWDGSKAYVNFNGGTFRMRNTSTVKVFDHAPNRVTVFAGGAAIDTNGRDRTLDCSLEAPEGNGVVAVDTTGLLDREFVGSPLVEIENVGESAGFGATAYADFDSVARRVTGIHVVNPGCNYTAAQAVIRYGLHLIQTNAVTLGTSVSGGLAKKGTGTLTLNCSNTITGPVSVEAGTLKVNADDALPASAAVSVAAGATLDLNGRSLSATSLGTTGGTVANGTLTLPSALTIDLAAAKAGTCPTFAAGTFAFPAGATVTLVNVDGTLDSNDGFYTLLKVENGSITGQPTLTNEGLSPWVLANTGREIRLAYPHGTVLIFR